MERNGSSVITECQNEGWEEFTKLLLLCFVPAWQKKRGKKGPQVHKAARNTEYNTGGPAPHRGPR